MVMGRTLFVLIVLLSVLWAPRFGFSDSTPLMAVGQAKTPAEGPSSASNDKNAQAAKDVKDVTVQAMEKLSNAVSSEYIIGAEDVLDITVWRNADLSKTVEVRPDGRVSLPSFVTPSLLERHRLS